MCSKKTCFCKLNVGDLVECVNNNWTSSTLTNGEIYTITDINRQCVKVKGLFFSADRFRKVEPKMEVGKDYHYKGAKTIARCVGFDGEFAIMRYNNFEYPHNSNEEFIYKRRKGKLGDTSWAEYIKPRVVKIYTHIEPNGNVCGWYDKPNLGSNIKVTFTDGVLTDAKVLL